MKVVFMEDLIIKEISIIKDKLIILVIFFF